MQALSTYARVTDRPSTNLKIKVEDYNSRTLLENFEIKEEDKNREFYVDVVSLLRI